MLRGDEKRVDSENAVCGRGGQWYVLVMRFTATNANPNLNLADPAG